MRASSSVVRADLTEFLAEPLGPATVARSLMDRPGEGGPVWAAYADTHAFDIPGLDHADDSSADLVVWGKALDCLAHRYVRMVSSWTGGPHRLYVLTRQRLALYTRAEPGGLLAKAARVRDGIVQLGKDLAERVADRRKLWGSGNYEGEPVTPPRMEPLAEIRRGQIAGFEVAERAAAPVLRLRLVDGSGLDFLVGMTDRDECEYALGLTNGAPPLRPGARGDWVATLAREALDQAAALLPGEEVLVAGTANTGYVGAQVGRELRVPHTPLGRMPALDLPSARWPLPAVSSQGPDGWLDDPTIAYWAQADRADRDAVALADLLAHTSGAARLVLTRDRLALVVATALLAAPPDAAGPVTSLLDVAPARVRGVTAELAGRSLPPKPWLRVDFTDGSTLRLRDPVAARHAAVLVGA
ncbi:hypothetical protein [Actinophytocola glycyrrhizae]|uniref:Uncharacterized protein n=1 Tax=Actinophytocola glycyrrhizae TaxID=2044873 RepID=A0ABV9RUC3_9PSEU